MRILPSLDAVRDRYDAVARLYDSSRARNNIRRFQIIDAPQLAAASGCHRVLEIGCGTGRLLEQANARSRVGIDISMQMVKIAKQRRSLEVTLGDAHRLPFRDRSFGAVIAGNGVVRYLNYSSTFAEAARVLVDGGRFGVHQYALETWSIQDLWRLRPIEPLHLSDLEQLRDPARAVGFIPEQCYLWRSTRFPPYVLPIPEWLPGKFWRHCTLIFRKSRS